MPTQSPWQPGATIGRYRLLAKIATGGMAEIWLAQQGGLAGFEKLVVVKRITESFASDPAFVTMFLDEARLAAQLSHPNIVQIYDLGQHAGSYYIAMEYVAGETLSAVVRESRNQDVPLPMTYAVRLIASAAEALFHAHTKNDLDGRALNIVHRDVSPQNLLVSYDGNVKVLDFGIAKAANRATHTSDSQVKGKLAYMPPEQANGLELDGRADVYALGVVLFEAVTRSRLHKDSDQRAIVMALIGPAELPSARERNPDVPETLSEILQRAMARDVEQRYRTARAFQEDLEEWLRGNTVVPTTSEIADYMRRVFFAQIAEQARCIEEARAGRAVQPPPGSAQRGQATMPGGTPTHTGGALAKRRRRLSFRLVATAAALVGIAGGGAFAVFRHPPSPVPTAPLPASLSVETVPAGALVSIDGKPAGGAPVTIEPLEIGDHRVSATLEGRDEAHTTVRITGPDQHQRLVLTLADKPAPAPAIDAGEAPALPARPGIKPSRGKLSLDTVPWTKVYLKDRLLGETPLIEVPVPAGHHKLRLVNSEEKVNRTIEINIAADRLTARKIRL